MRLILSRKGFDSSSGGCASPILPDGRLLSLPIPSRGGVVRYGDLAYDSVEVGQLVHDLSHGKVGPGDTAHLDPDLVREIYPREPGWRGAFGQVDAAQVHLANHGVGPGDVFLFFGWFREVCCVAGRWSFKRGAPDLHVLFGWLQVGESIDVTAEREAVLARRPWLRGHPHFASAAVPNVVYVAADRFHIQGSPGSLPGAGAFHRAHPELFLTRPGQRLRTTWRLPGFFEPRPGRPPLSYHERPGRWMREGSDVILRSVARGQEFVLDLATYPEVEDWVVNTVTAHAVGLGA